jgi:dimethylargininase
MDFETMNEPEFTHGFAREVSRSLEKCELLYVPRQGFDLPLARRQHAAYIATLEAAGIKVTVLPEEPDLPDSCFVEDPAIVLDEVAVICRPGAASRVAEVESIERALKTVRPVHRIASPGTLEGGDVLRMGKTLFIGMSSRTNLEGIRQCQEIIRPHGYEAVGVRVKGCLHLKSAVTSPAEGLLIANAEWIDLSPFSHFEILRVPESEPWAANTLAFNGSVLVTGSSPRTAELLESKGFLVRRLDISELQKAEAALTCLSLLFSMVGTTAVLPSGT